MSRSRAEARAFARHVASFGGGRVVAALVSGVWLVVAARQLTLTQFGDLSVLLSVGAIFGILCDLGWPLLLTDAVARAGGVGRRTLVHVIARRLGAGCAAAVLTALFYVAVASDRRVAVVALFGVSLLATAVHSSVTAVLRGLGSYGTDAVNDVASRVGVLALGSLWLASGGGLLAAVAVYALADLVSATGIGLLAWRRVTAWDDAIDHRAFSFRASLHLSGGRLLETLYYRVDLWLVALISGSAAAALYSAPYRLLDGLQLLPRSMGVVALSHAASREREGGRGYSAARLAAVAGGMAAVVALPAALFARPVLVTGFGPAMAPAVPIFVVLMAAAVPGAVVMALLARAAVLESRRFARSMAVALLVNVAMNAVMIPLLGPVGAAWTTLACQTGLAARLIVILRRREGEAPAGRAAVLAELATEGATVR